MPASLTADVSFGFRKRNKRVKHSQQVGICLTINTWRDDSQFPFLKVEPWTSTRVCYLALALHREQTKAEFSFLLAWQQLHLWLSRLCFNHSVIQVAGTHYTPYLLFAPSYTMYLLRDKAYGGECCSFYDGGRVYFALHCSRSRWVLDSKLSSSRSVSGCILFLFYFFLLLFWQNSICGGVTHCAKPAVVLMESKDSRAQNKPFKPVGAKSLVWLLFFSRPAQLPPVCA